jgi:hypothetical protein|tara:strand:+ start:1998 stop:4064 length:2067 start_codon:yes stop_codon:yes gene_type:complete
LTSRSKYIKIFRDAGFNCFILKRKGGQDTKVADSIWQARRTQIDTVIPDDSNYGVCGRVGRGNGILDLDDKEKYRLFAEGIISKGFMVIETGKGWHIPIKGFSDDTSKLQFADSRVGGNKVVEFQGVDHYVVGAGSVIWHDKLNQEITYTNVGTDIIWDVRGKDFNAWADVICAELKLQPLKKTSRSSYGNLRQKFRDGKIPSEGQSNDYFHQATLVCMKDKLTQDEAEEKIKLIYDKWQKSEYASARTWTSIKTKIQYTYEHDTPPTEGRPQGGGGSIDRTEIAKNILSTKKLFSNIDTGNLFINTNGFLENYNNKIGRELIERFPELEEPDERSIIFKLLRMSPEMPVTNDDYFVFKNGIRSLITKEKVDTEEIGSMGFKDYDYLDATPENEPKRFMEVFFGNIPKSEWGRAKAGLKSIITSTPDVRMSILVGGAGSGKTKSAEILEYVLGDEYALSVTVSQFITDHFIRAHIDGKRLLIFQDMPDSWKDFEIIKTLTGENSTTQRGFHQDKKKVVNRLKVFGCANYLAKIPADEKNPMYSRRLSLLHKDPPSIPYIENPNLSREIAEEEGEKIISWIFNLNDEEYENGKIVKEEYEKLSSPETEFLQKNFEFTPDQVDVKGVVTILKEFNAEYHLEKDIAYMATALKAEGYNVSYSNSIVKNCLRKRIEPKKPDSPQRTFQSDDD